MLGELEPTVDAKRVAATWEVYVAMEVRAEEEFDVTKQKLVEECQEHDRHWPTGNCEFSLEELVYQQKIQRLWKNEK